MTTKLCPWSGMPCDCLFFPWLDSELVPAKCEMEMPIEIAGIRKVSAALKARYKSYLIPCTKCKARYEKIDGVKHGFCEKCKGQ